MTAADAAWLHMDRGANLAEVTGLFLARRPVDFARARDEFLARLRPFDRFHRPALEPSLFVGRPRWGDLPGWDPGQQVRRLALPAPHDEAALVDLVSKLASTPLDRSRPLWELHVVDGVGEGSALVFRFHHCLIDGTATIALLEELFGTTSSGPAPQPPEPCDTLVGWGARVLRRPGRLVDAAALVGKGTAIVLAEMLGPADPPSPLRGECGGRQRVAWSEPLPLEDIKLVGSTCDATVNDVLVAVLTGALRAYLAARGSDVAHRTLHAVVPFNLRPRERGLDLGNDFGLVFLGLPIGTAASLRRVRAIQTRMGLLKRSAEATAIRALLAIFGTAPKVLEDVAVDLFERRASLVFSNVIGPAQGLALAGVPIDRLVFFAPHPGRHLALAATILSYAGSASLGVLADARLVPDPEALTRGFTEEFARMVARARRARRRRAAAQPS